MARTLLLDLDGTLVDSVPDLAAALNRLMESRGLAPFAEAETAAMVGDGVAVLVERAFAARGGVPDAAAVADFSADYGAHVAVESRLYPGVAETLGDLAARAGGWRSAPTSRRRRRARCWPRWVWRTGSPRSAAATVPGAQARSRRICWRRWRRRAARGRRR